MKPIIYLFITLFLFYNLPAFSQDSLDMYWIRKLNIASVSEYYLRAGNDTLSADTILHSVKYFNKYHKLSSETYYSDTGKYEIIYGLKFDTLTVQKRGTNYPSGKLYRFETYEHDKLGRKTATYKYYNKRRVKVESFKYNKMGQLYEVTKYSSKGRKLFKLTSRYDDKGREYFSELRDYRVDTSSGGIYNVPFSYRMRSYEGPLNKISSEYIYDDKGDTITYTTFEYSKSVPYFVTTKEYFLTHPYNNKMKHPVDPAKKQIRRNEYYHMDNGIYYLKKEYTDGRPSRTIQYRYTYHPVK